MHGKVSTIEHNGKDIFKDIINPVEVCRYHSLVLKNTNKDIEVTAFTIEKEIMAFKHRNLPLYGVQFHPEAILTKSGLQMINNWLSQ